MIHGPSTARTLALASAAAYEPSGVVVGDEQCLACLKRVHDPYSRGDDATVIAFQGSNDTGDWISNIDRHKVDTPHGGIHRGIWTSMTAWFGNIAIAAGSVASPQVWVTGHSRGGAQALVFAAMCAQRGIRLAGCYTFGAPRVGDSRFAAWCDTHLPGHHRYVYQSDIVPRLPRIGYTHCGHLHWHDGHEWRTRMPWHSRIGAFLFARKWPFIGNAAADHSINEYVKALS